MPEEYGDGISAKELKVLPELAISHLHQLLRGPDPFPKWMMIARTLAVPKQTRRLPASKVRPIPVLAQIYRLWSQILALAIIHRILPFCPKKVTGFRPGRSGMDASYTQQRLIEVARNKQTRCHMQAAPWISLSASTPSVGKSGGSLVRECQGSTLKNGNIHSRICPALGALGDPDRRVNRFSFPQFERNQANVSASIVQQSHFKHH